MGAGDSMNAAMLQRSLKGGVFIGDHSLLEDGVDLAEMLAPVGSPF